MIKKALISWRLAGGAISLAAVLSIIFLAALPLHGDSTKTAAVSIKDGFDPDSLTIHTGDTVTWTNNDDRDHNVTADDGSFASGNLKAGKTFSHTFLAVGKFPYACLLHPRERGTVIVEK